MSGHSKFANIKHKKEKNDAKKGKIFTVIGREIVIAVKEGGPDPNNNSKLRDVIAKAKANNMPNDTIERGIKKAAGDVDARTIRPPVRYDGKGRNTDYVLRQRSGTEDAAGSRIHRGTASGPSGWQKGNIEGEEDTSHHGGHGGHREHFLFHILKARD